MKKRTPIRLWLALLAVTLSLSAITFATAHILSRKSLHATSTAQESPRVNRSLYVRRGLLSPRLAQNLSALGNRLERSGKERLAFTGSLEKVGGETREFAVVSEFPDRLRLVVQNGAQGRVISFDGVQIRATHTPAAADELDLIETLVYDSAEHFFATQMQGNATRFLGTRFRADDGTNPDYRGPYHDIYKIADQITSSGHSRPAKLYYFNSDTLLLERVTYVINRDGSEVNVETKLSNWREVEGQKVARRIERIENGKPVFVFNVRSAQTGARAADGIFAQ